MKKIFMLLLIFINAFLLSGCWNYKEIEQLAIVAGVAVDRGEDGKLKMTVEIVNITSGEKGGEIKPVYIEINGDTFFDAARAAVLLTGKRLYWGHAKVIILSQDIADREVERVLDFALRDPEVREDMWVMVSKEKTAREILQSKPVMERIVSFEIDSALRAQKSVSRYPNVKLYEFVNRLSGDKEAPFLPAAELAETKEGKTIKMHGTAIFDRNRLTGWLDENETKNLLWVRNEIKGGLYVIEKASGTNTNVTLEVYRSKTKVKPIVYSREIQFDIDIKPIVYLAEIEGSTDFVSEKGRAMLKEEAEERIKKDVEEFIEKVQEEYRIDIFGFGRKLEIYYPGIWKGIKDDWKEVFQGVETNVSVELEIRESGTRKKPIMTGE